jgi:hypothetical protein
MFPEKRGAWLGQPASRQREERTGAETKTPYLSSNLSVVIFQSLIQLTRRFTIRKTIMCDFVKAALSEIVPNLAAVDAVFGGIDTEDFTKKLKRTFPVPLEICQNLTDIEVPFGTETAGIEKDIARDWNAHDRAPDIDIWKVEGLPIESHETVGPNLTDIGPEVGEKFPFVRLTISA